MTLIFSPRQYHAARDAVWRGAQQRSEPRTLQERLQHLRLAGRCLHREARAHAQPGRAGPGRHRQRQADLGRQPQVWWATRSCRWPRRSSSPAPAPRSPRTRRGSTSKRSPAATSRPIRRPRTKPSPRAAARSRRQVDQLPPQAVLDEIAAKVDIAKLEAVLMEEGHQEVRRSAEGAAQAHRREAKGAVGKVGRDAEY